MSIGIDARLIEETGVGRYTRNLIEELSSIDKENRYIVFLRKKSFNTFVVPNNRWQKRLADVRWHTVSEQFVMSRLFSKEHLDVVHIPYHNPPIFYKGNMVITIHDLTILHFDTGRATTLPYPIYKLKWFGYWLELAIGLRKAKKVIAVSQATKQEIIDHFSVQREKISVTYEGVEMKKTDKKRIINAPYFLYVGNAYPHKNIETLLRAAQRARVKLIFAGSDDYFYKKLHIETMSNLTDEQLANLYTYAQALVFPSFMEGFGLPALEAFACDCPVIASDIPVFHELLGDVPKYFDPRDEDELFACLRNPPVRSALFREKVQALVKKYSWQRMAAETLKIYEDSVRL